MSALKLIDDGNCGNCGSSHEGGCAQVPASKHNPSAHLSQPTPWQLPHLLILRQQAASHDSNPANRITLTRLCIFAGRGQDRLTP